MIYPVILAGGAGTRLWPLSRKSYPKQFATLEGEGSLFQKTVKRLDFGEMRPPLILTGEDYRFLVRDQLDEIDASSQDILIEPEGRNTAPAVLTAALALESEPDAIILVLPSDHEISDGPDFQEAIEGGAKAAENGRIVTFGIKPTRAETGYGYLKLGKKVTDRPGEFHDLVQFVEKPCATRAEEMVASGNYLWNAGMFMFRVSTIIDAFEALAPQLIIPCRAALSTASLDLGFKRLGAEAYRRTENISIDYAIMEKSEKLSVVPIGANWCDLGSWKSVHSAYGTGEDNNALSDGSKAIDCRNTLLRTEGNNVRMVGVGLDNIAAIAVGDAVLIADMDRSEDVKIAVAELKAEGAVQAEEFPRCHRPWGYYESLAVGDRFQVKRIMVRPGGVLSLQSHVHRSEHWVVVAGSAQVTIDEEVKLITENQSVYIPLGAVHRLENPGKVPLNLIEVQSGPYLGEDDIVRYEDIYDRVNAA